MGLDKQSIDKNKAIAKRYFKRYFKEQYFNENDAEFKSFVRALNKKDLEHCPYC